MWRLLRLLFTGWWNDPPLVRTFKRRLDDLEDRIDYQQQQLRRLRGHVTGGLRYGEEEPEIWDSEIEITAGPPADFPEEEFQRRIQENIERRKHGTG